LNNLQIIECFINPQKSLVIRGCLTEIDETLEALNILKRSKMINLDIVEDTLREFVPESSPEIMDRLHEAIK
jgi:hypothetical protein